MKYVFAALATLILFTVQLHAEQLILAHFSHTTVQDDETDLEFDVNGYDFTYMNFNDNNLYYAVGWGFASGEDELCLDDFCIDFESDSSGLLFEIGYNFDNPFTPFVSVTRSEWDVDLGITGLGLGDATESDTTIGVGTWFGDEDRRLRLAFDGVDTDDPGVSIGGYTVLDNNLALSGSYFTSTESPGDIWGLSIGLGWSF